MEPSYIRKVGALDSKEAKREEIHGLTEMNLERRATR